MKANVLVNTINITEDEWLKWRTQGIGGSDVGAILGLNKYKSSVDIYLEKIGQGKEYEESEAAYWGTTLEAMVSEEFTKRTGKKLKKRNAILQHPEYPFMLANVDRLVIGEKAGFEAKTASAYKAEEWENGEIPESYQLQCIHYMAVTGLDTWYIAVLIGGQKFVWYRIDRDEELINYVIEIEKNFWNNNVLAKVPPQLDGSEASENILKVLYPQATNNEVLNAPADIEIMVMEREALADKIAELEEKLKEKENRIKDFLGEHEAAVSNDYIISWKNQKGRSLFDKDKFNKDFPGLYDKYTKEGNPSRKFMIKKRV